MDDSLEMRSPGEGNDVHYRPSMSGGLRIREGPLEGFQLKSREKALRLTWLAGSAGFDLADEAGPIKMLAIASGNTSNTSSRDGKAKN